MFPQLCKHIVLRPQSESTSRGVVMLDAQVLTDVFLEDSYGIVKSFGNFQRVEHLEEREKVWMVENEK